MNNNDFFIFHTKILKNTKNALLNISSSFVIIHIQYGGDVTRRMKLLKNQAEGKKKMRSMANIRVPHETFIKVLRK